MPDCWKILYNWTDSYGLAIILFALVVNLILLPFMAKSKRGMMKTTVSASSRSWRKSIGAILEGSISEGSHELYGEQVASPTPPAACVVLQSRSPATHRRFTVSSRQPLGSMMGLGDESIKKLTEWATQNAGFVSPQAGHL